MRAVIFAPPATGGAGRVLLVIHHLAIDGVSWRFLLDELATAYASPQAPLPAVPSTWARWAQALVREASSEMTRAELGWWEAISAQPLPRDRPAPGCGRADAEASVTTTLEPADTQRLLQDSATAYRTQVNDLLLTALAQTLARWTGSSGATVALEGHGREEIAGAPDMTRTISWFTTLYPVALSLAGAAGDGDAIKQVKEQLRAVPRRGLGYGLLRYCGEAPVRARLAAHGLPELCFNYLGQVDAGAEAAAAGGFFPATESRGADHGPANARAFLIEINAVVAGGALRCDWNYSPEPHDAATIRRLAEDFRTALLRLVAHCVQADAGGLTPSDFPDAQVSQDDLDKLMNRLE
jgi:non-ribosomal peptide synthase protein (TIGR01720 family)